MRVIVAPFKVGLMQLLRIFVFLLILLPSVSPANTNPCSQPLLLGPAPSRLLVIVPGTTQNAANWHSFLDALRTDVRAQDLAVLVYEHGIGFTTVGSAYSYVGELNACIQEKVTHRKFTKVTLVGHSIGGMLARRAYLDASSKLIETPSSWTTRVDRILLFASVNRGVPNDATWWSPIVNWTLRALPHPHFVLEDMAAGSDFISDTRIAWLRFFGRWSTTSESQPTPTPPRIFQYWGTVDSIVKEKDNADLEAFSGEVLVRVPGAKHSDLQRLEPEYSSARIRALVTV